MTKQENRLLPPLAAGHPHGAMRRGDREIIDPAQLQQILMDGHVMYLALASGDDPFVLPLFYVYDGEALYFHSAKRGSKMALLARNPKVCFCISDYQGVIPDPQACNFEARHRTVIGQGIGQLIEDKAQKVAVLDRLVARFSDQRFTYPEASLTATSVVRIEIVTMKGKQHGIDAVSPL